MLDASKAALALAPASKVLPLPVSPISGEPEWHSFETEAWAIGEGIRQALKTHPKLRKSEPIQLALLAVIGCKSLGRGRQSFFFSLGHVDAAERSDKVARYLLDPEVQGHALDALLKMRVSGYSSLVEPLLRSSHSWVRSLAKKYQERHRRVA